MKKHRLKWLVSSVLGAAAPLASAQPAATLEEVVVTAQRRAENLQRTPVSVTALNADALENRQVTNVLDVAAQVPNLRIEPVTGLSNAARVFLRGVGEDQSTPTTDNAIGLYVDGVYYPRTLGALFDFVDVERIEVLRGPQGTLYGRNTSGGAIKILTKNPGEAWAGTVDLTAGNFDRRQVRASVGGPLGDTLRGAVSVLRQERDGTSYDTTLARDVNRKDVTAARGKLLWAPSDAVELTLAADWTEDQSDVGVGTSALTGPPADLYVTAANGDPTGYLRTRGVALTGTWNDGPYTLTSITAWRDLDNTGTLDNDGRPTTVLHFFFDAEQSQWSQELTLAADWDRVKAIVGAYWFTEDNYYPNASIIGANRTLGLASQDTESYAVFGQATFALTDALSVTAGGRFTWDQKDFQDVYPTLNRRYEADENWTAFTPRLSLEYQATPDTFLFASWSKGYKAGGFNRSTVAITALTPYDEENVTTAELGLKSQFLDDRVRANVTLFHNDYQDLQLSAFDPATNVSRRFNAAAATTQGVEVETSAVLARGLTAYATLGYLDAQYDEFVDRVNGVLTDVSYLDLKGAPKWSYSAGVSWTLPLQIPGSVTVNADVSRRSRVENNVANTPAIATPGVTLTNASVAWTSASDRWTVSLAGKNLGDEEYVANGLFIGGLTTLLYPADPRTWSATLRYQF
jgi:iron complex outermembrane receptor protein